MRAERLSQRLECAVVVDLAELRGIFQAVVFKCLDIVIERLVGAHAMGHRVLLAQYVSQPVLLDQADNRLDQRGRVAGQVVGWWFRVHACCLDCAQLASSCWMIILTSSSGSIGLAM